MKRPIAFHPILFAAFPVLALYAHNIKSLPISFGELAAPLALSLAGAAGLQMVLWRILRNPIKGGIATTLALIWFFSIGRIIHEAEEFTGGVYSLSLLFASLIILGFVALPLIRSKRSFSGFARFLNIMAASLILMNLASITQTLLTKHHIGLESILSGPDQTSANPLAEPDIYYIVLDAYTRTDILEEVFAFDNSPFIDFLEKKGFFVASRSYANYSLTHQSIASSLNFTYLDEIFGDKMPASSDRIPLNDMIQNNRVMAYLKSRGYRTIAVSSGLPATEIQNADRFIGFRTSPSEFRNAFLEITPAWLFLDFSSSYPEYDIHRERILGAFKKIQEAAEEENGPFFFFAHVMAPHPPFVFGPRGEPIEPDYLYSQRDAERMHGANQAAIRDYIVKYRNQLAFLNTKTMEAVEAILTKSSRPAVIIIQGDHGSRAYSSLDRPAESYFKENLAILNAYHLPGQAREKLYSEISPVNSFRLVFKEYFGLDMDLVRDRSFWCPWKQPYRFIPFEESSYNETLETIREKINPRKPTVVRKPAKSTG